MTIFFFRYAILNEVWRLVADGVLDVRDIDSVMSDGLGMRYAFLGAFETAHLNAEGMLNYCDRYNKSIYDVSSMTFDRNRKIKLKNSLVQVSQTMGETPRMIGPVAEEISRQLEQMCPLDKLAERRAWRDKCLTKLSQLKKSL